MDEALLQHLVGDGINCFSMEAGNVLHDLGWGSQHFAKMGRSKINLIAMFLELGVQVTALSDTLSKLSCLVAGNTPPDLLVLVIGLALATLREDGALQNQPHCRDARARRAGDDVFDVLKRFNPSLFHTIVVSGYCPAVLPYD